MIGRSGSRLVHAAAQISQLSRLKCANSLNTRWSSTTSKDHVPQMFEPAAASGKSPMRRKYTWIEALTKLRAAKRRGDFTGASLEPQLPAVPTLTNKSMSDSYTEVRLNLKSDKWLMDVYCNAAGRLRIGQIFQDLDALAGVIAHKHCLPYEPFLVTASVDRVYMLKRMETVQDLILAGAVTWTGRSSVEITICVDAKSESDTDQPGGPDRLADFKSRNRYLVANFTFVARNPTTNKAYPINHIEPSTENERKLFEQGERHNMNKKRERDDNLDISPPSNEESLLIYNLIQHPPPECIRVADTTMKSTMIMQPQYRNLHSFMIFGGYLLRQTFELAYCCVAALSHHTPRFYSMDTTSFRNPVPVGSVLYMTAAACYSEPQDEGSTIVQIVVDTVVRDILHGTTTPTGQFTYSFYVHTHVDIVPETYQEALRYLQGRRTALATRMEHPSTLNSDDTPHELVFE
ncbi:hypothetical protein CANCADRAFT_106941 [Tortispora caseinolytica NRRL Y-17796]|uniref:HotDog ACOT-type domain-containing protein n=1 Tax=Tortispora caseinolytica NRRL Y-17796 TaxID=767744 RepID=A0A1E4TFE5_9ASCO|nr:hypothetical protein CANCADRAFT_106941 [Tortispora caseinolytica NRRL Y-17796]